MENSCEDECKDVYGDKKCKCYITENSIPDEDGNYNDTFCGFFDDGFIWPCDSSCCEPACPGECTTVPRKEDIEHIPMMIEVRNKIQEDTPQMSIIKFMLYIIIALAIMSTISLWA